MTYPSGSAAAPRKRRTAKEGVRVIGSGQVLWAIFNDEYTHGIPNPYADPHIVHSLTWGETPNTLAASLIGSFDYLLSANIPLSDAVRRLRALRKVRADAASRLTKGASRGR